MRASPSSSFRVAALIFLLGGIASSQMVFPGGGAAGGGGGGSGESTVYMQADKSGDTAVNSGVTVPTWTENFDEGAGFDPATGVYTVPSDGRYLVVATLADTGTGTYRPQVLHTIAGPSTSARVGVRSSKAVSISTLLDCTTGDTISIAPHGANITVDAVSGTDILTHLFIIKL